MPVTDVSAYDMAIEGLELPKCSDRWTRVALAYRWHVVHPDTAIPTDLDQLRLLVPVGTEEEVLNAMLNLWGGQAKSRFMYLINSGSSQKRIWEQAIAEGLADILALFDDGSKGRLLEVISCRKAE